MPAQSPLPDPEHLAHNACRGAINRAVRDTVFFFLKGLYRSPSGHGLAGGVQRPGGGHEHAAHRLPGGQIGVQEAIKCTLAHARQRNDSWNSVVACGSAAALLSVHVVGPLAAFSYGLHAAAVDGAFRAFVELFRLDHPCSLPESAARHADGFPGFPVTSIVVEEVSVYESA